MPAASSARTSINGGRSRSLPRSTASMLPRAPVVARTSRARSAAPGCTSSRTERSRSVGRGLQVQRDPARWQCHRVAMGMRPPGRRPGGGRVGRTLARCRRRRIEQSLEDGARLPAAPRCEQGRKDEEDEAELGATRHGSHRMPQTLAMCRESRVPGHPSSSTTAKRHPDEDATRRIIGAQHEYEPRLRGWVKSPTGGRWRSQGALPAHDPS